MKHFKKIICLGFEGEELDPSQWEQVDSMCDMKLLVNKLNILTPEQSQEVDCLLLKLGAQVSAQDMKALPKLSYIGMFGTGYGGVDASYAAKQGIVVTNIADYATEGVAEFTFAILLEYLRSVCYAKQQAKIGDYSDIKSSEIKNKTFGVVGLGNIGLRTAELAQAFGARVIYWSQNRKGSAENKGITYVPAVWAKADIVTINLALNTNSEKFMSAKRIAKIKKGAIVINVSPMELIDFEALVNRLKKNDMTFLLDHSDEMTKEQLKILGSFANCIIYPPIAYLTGEATRLKKEIYIHNLRSFLSGSPTSRVN